jgi:hypothetical protein
MRHHLVLRGGAALCALLLAAGACGDDVCEEAYDKMEACVANLDCNKLDPVEMPKCLQAKNNWDQYSGNRTAYTTACGADSNIKSKAEEIASCALDPKTCTCP